MMFNSILFGFFLPLVFIIYWLIPRKKIFWQNVFVVFASYVFYGAWDWRFLLLIAFTTFCSWLSGILLQRYGKDAFPSVSKWIAGTNIVINLIILGVFKYYNFFASSLSDLFGFAKDDFVLENIILPVGISFYTFQALSYTIDVYRKKISATKDIIAFFAFVSFFPQLVAGPIERATSLLPQFLRERSFNYNEAVDGCRRMLWGFFKKLFIADLCAQYVNSVWADYSSQSSGTLILAAFFFVFQVYGDFSGYSDIAIGCSQLFGIRLNDNFKLPFFSRDIAEFWRRWHISLNSWFVDYVYIPLGGSRNGMVMKLRNVFVIFIVSGLWHGANWTYVLWGLFHALCFVPIVLTKSTRRYTNDLADLPFIPSLREIFGMFTTFWLFVISMVVFRAPNIATAWDYMVCVAGNGFGEINYSKYVVTPALIGIFVCMFVEWTQRAKRHGLEISCIRQWWIRVLIYYALLLAILLYTGESQTFIYFQF